MKNKHGFTLVELLATIVILGILATIAIVSVSRYHKRANDKEIITLRSSITAAFGNYRINNKVNKNSLVNINNLSFTQSISYDGKQCNIGDSNIKYIVKGDYIDIITIEEEQIYYGICVPDMNINSDNEVIKSCKKDSNNSFLPSKEEDYCVKLYCNGTLIIDDYSNNNSLCSK